MMAVSKATELHQQTISLPSYPNKQEFVCPSLDDWSKIQQFNEKHPQFKTQMRWLLLHRKTNGLEAHVRKIGKFLYLSESGFLNWIQNDCER